MAKMKQLQPEMARLKDLHKEDKMKLQQEMMALYKKEKVNPMSGCLPILVQIPVFFAFYKILFVTLADPVRRRLVVVRAFLMLPMHWRAMPWLSLKTASLIALRPLPRCMDPRFIDYR